MRTPASIAGHPIHPMLVPVAIGGFILSFVFDIVCMVSGNVDPWASVAYFTMVGGIVGALCAALFGFVDITALPAGRVRHTGLLHMGLNLVIVVLYVLNAWYRHGNPDRIAGPMLLSLVSLVLLVASGWLGGRMVYECGVGVDPAGEALNAPTGVKTGRRLEA